LIAVLTVATEMDDARISNKYSGREVSFRKREARHGVACHD